MADPGAQKVSLEGARDERDTSKETGSKAMGVGELDLSKDRA